MIRDLIDAEKPEGAEAKEDFEQLIYDMRHGSHAVMHAIEHGLDGSALWWLTERLCEQARLLETRFCELPD
jgi:hypothetical protein